MNGVYCCECGVQTRCEWTDLNIGRVMQCPSCKVTSARVLGLSGGTAWLRLEQSQVDFYELLVKQKEDEE